MEHPNRAHYHRRASDIEEMMDGLGLNEADTRELRAEISIMSDDRARDYLGQLSGKPSRNSCNDFYIDGFSDDDSFTDDDDGFYFSSSDGSASTESSNGPPHADSGTAQDGNGSGNTTTAATAIIDHHPPSEQHNGSLSVSISLPERLAHPSRPNHDQQRCLPHSTRPGCSFCSPL